MQRQDWEAEATGAHVKKGGLRVGLHDDGYSQWLKSAQGSKCVSDFTFSLFWRHLCGVRGTSLPPIASLLHFDLRGCQREHRVPHRDSLLLYHLTCSQSR